MRQERASRVSPLMLNNILAVVAPSEMGVSLGEIVEAIQSGGRSKSVARVGASKALRGLWLSGFVELHDGAGQTMTGLRRRARQIADRARANPRAAEAFRIARITLTAAGRELLGKAAGLTST